MVGDPLGVFPQKSWTDKNYRYFLERVPESPGLACFDFDNTLIRNDFGEKMMDAVIGEGLVHVPTDLSKHFRDEDLWLDHRTIPLEKKEHLIWEEYAYQLKEFGIERGYRWTSFLFSGLSKTEFYRLSKEAWKKVAEFPAHTAVFPQPEMKDLISFLYRHNWDVWIVTASPELGVMAISDSFPIPEDKVVGMRQYLTMEGLLSGIIEEPYTYGEGKVLAIQKRIGRIPDLAFGDSFNDFPMLCYAKKGIAIDKGNPEFIKACLDKEILIQPYFSFVPKT